MTLNHPESSDWTALDSRNSRQIAEALQNNSVTFRFGVFNVYAHAFDAENKQLVLETRPYNPDSDVKIPQRESPKETQSKLDD